MKQFLQIMLILILPTQVMGANFDIVEHCDIGAPSTQNFPAKDPEACRELCSKEAKCLAFTFISGWNRCFFKNNTKPQATVKMFSGSIAEQDHKRVVVDEGYQKDHKGKDWKKLPTNNPDECKKACLEAKPCLGFTLIEGYRTCWLKNTFGRLQSKTFYCGIKR